VYAVQTLALNALETEPMISYFPLWEIQLIRKSAV
jgi:hypothetical protein